MITIPTFDIDHFRARVLQDALNQATPQFWIHRAMEFEAAAPRLGDYHGQSTQEELWERYNNCSATAEACRRHARLLWDTITEISTDVIDVLAEVA